MAGEAKTDAFMLGTATVMLGAMADLMNLTVDQSIGLVKNVTMKTTPSFTELTQGVKNTLVYSVMTANQVMIDGEMYEYTSRNLSYAAGLDGSEIEASTVSSLVTTGVVAPTPPALSDEDLTVASGTEFAIGDTVFVQVGNADQVLVRKITAKAINVLTFDTGFPIAIPVGSKVTKVNVVAIGSLEDTPFLACKIVGTMANGDEVVVLLPKVRVTSGVSLGFKTDNFDNMPLQLSVYDLVSTDPLYAYFQSVGPSGRPAKAQLLTKS